MPGSHQAVIVGAGHNGLTCACYLAKAGLEVLVLKECSEIGGMTISAEIARRPFRALPGTRRCSRHDRRHRLGHDQGGLRRSHHRLGRRHVPSRAQGPHRRAIGAVAGRYGTAHPKRRARHSPTWRLSALPDRRHAADPELGSYRSPIANVYLCGVGSHPGSGVTMAPGRNAAQVICGDLGVAFPS